MASGKEYLHFILEQLSKLDVVSYRPMMGEFILYYRGKIVGGIYDDRLLVKKTRSALELMPAAICEPPYEGAKEMLLVDEVDSKEFLTDLVEAMYDELFSLQSTHLCNMKQNGYQTAAFGYFSLMPFYAPVFFTAATTIAGILSSLSVTLPPFDWRVFLRTSCETERSTV